MEVEPERTPVNIPEGSIRKSLITSLKTNMNKSQDKCINVKVDGMSVIVRTSEKEISQEAMQNIRDFIKHVRMSYKGGDTYEKSN
jgi:hypothetical protein